jgi:hypothetical protein
MFSNTLDIHVVDVEAIPCGFRASASTTVHHGDICCGGVNQEFGKVPKCVPTAVGVTT